MSIKLKCLNTETFSKFEITKFPDGTSQVWKIDPYPYSGSNFEVIWQFENEEEFCHVLQLGYLLFNACNHKPTLKMPFLPYGRQDKDFNNESTFAKHAIFMPLSDVYNLATFDAHSSETQGKTYSIYSENPAKFFRSVYNHDVVCFPDRGAHVRYQKHFPDAKIMVLKKKRNQQTGEIEGLELGMESAIERKDGMRILIVDDICDGGRTFMEAVKVIRAAAFETEVQVDLAVSHGIFSKGRQVLHDAGITNIFTTNSLPQNAEGFNILS